MLKKSSFKDKKVLVFDLDGTIVKLNVNWKELKQILSERYSNIYNTSCQFNSISGCLSYVVSKDDKKELENFFDIIREFEVKNIDNNTPIEESIYFIKYKNEFGIDDGAKLAILSLNTRKTVIESLKKEKILDKFDFIVGREDVRRWKPEPEGLVIIKNHYGIKSDEMLYIGDMRKDMLTGDNAGVDTYLIDDLIQYVKDHKKN
ncbi:MAG: Pyrophosphatase PpaX [Promethearchaeota archaeon]|nr:MAG: Pyrophosphatase PpaX [Candidatus Lokiarchaeota archaeon]